MTTVNKTQRIKTLQELAAAERRREQRDVSERLDDLVDAAGEPGDAGEATDADRATGSVPVPPRGNKPQASSFK